MIDPVAGPLAEQVSEATGGRGFDVVIEAAGAPAAMASAFPIAGLGARIVLVGIDVGGSAPVEIGVVQSKALQVRGIIGSAGLWPRTIRFMATSGVDPTPLLTATFPLGEGTAALDAARDTVATSRSRSSADQMRAAVFHGAGDVRIETVGDPSAPSPDEVVLEVTRAAICGTDAAEWDHGPVLCRPGVDSRARVRGSCRRARRRTSPHSV